MVDIYISPTGKDTNPGTRQEPFATLERAQLAAQQATNDVTIHLRAGTYPLSQTLTVNAPTKHHITYQAYEHDKTSEKVIISGGHVIVEWQQNHDIWETNIGERDARQLYVDGERVERASIQSLPENTHVTKTGYTVPTAEMPQWQTPSSVELVYRGVYPWTEARCGVSSVRHDTDSTVITMTQPAFTWAHELYNSAWDGNTSSGPGLPTRIENDASFLTPGSFAIDRSTPGQHILRYAPRADEDPSTTHVVLPALETLIRLTNVRNMSFKGLTFADATWLLPNRDQAFLHYHGSGYYNGTGEINKVVVVEDQAWVTVP
ncbi:MAG: DUF1565 domain-containing protein, partial [Corynebacteriales bacterium]|nr:DUF1565 domain-containing protein [Mycobacteriales bacterium]